MRCITAMLLCILIASAQELPKFTAKSQLVVEAVTVTDKSGKPIEGLTAQDFVLTENGVPQQIRICEFQKLEDACWYRPSPPAPWPRRLWSRPKGQGTYATATAVCWWSTST